MVGEPTANIFTDERANASSKNWKEGKYICSHNFYSTLYFFKNYFTEVQLIYNIVLTSDIQQSDSLIHMRVHTHIYIHTYILFHIFSTIVYHRVLDIVCCAIQ